MLDKKVEMWKAKLLDLSLRNRLINFKEGSSILRIFSPVNPRQFYDDIVMKGKSYLFLKDPNSKPKRSNYIKHNLNDRDSYKKLYKIYLSSRESLNEQAVNTLYLTFGMLDYVDEENNSLRAPLIMVPVNINRRKDNSKLYHPFELEFLDDDIYVNPALRQKLINSFNVDIDLPFESLDEYFVKLEKLISDNGWTLDRDFVTLGIFSFQKLSLYRDLITHRELIMSHPIIRKLGGEEVSLEVPNLDDNLDMLDPKDNLYVLDADSSQQRAILAARRGHSFVLQGPPGTGKSQTIANMIAQLLADGKRVLFVSEKMAALEAVKKRLDPIGIGHYLLEMHNASSNGKRWVLEQLEKALSENKLYEHDENLIENLSSMRNVLINYGIELLNQGLPITPYVAYGRLARLSHVKFTNVDVDLKLDFDEFKDNMEKLKELDRYDDQLKEYPKSIFKYLNNSKFKSFNDMHRVKYLDLLNRGINSLMTLDNDSKLFYEKVGVLFKCMDDLVGVDNKLSLFINAEIPEEYSLTSEWFTADIHDVLKILNRLKLKENEASVITNYFESKYSPEIFDLDDLDLIYDRLTKNYSLPPARWIAPGYKEIELKFRELLKSKDIKLDYSDLVNDVRQLITYKNIKRDILRDESYIKELLHINYVNLEQILRFYQWLNNIKSKKMFNPHLMHSLVEGNVNIREIASKLQKDIDEYVDLHLEINELFTQSFVERNIRFASWERLISYYEYIANNATKISKWIEFKNTLDSISEELKGIFEKAMSDSNRSYLLSELYEKLFLLKYLESIDLKYTPKSREYLDMVRDNYLLSDREHKYFSRSKIIQMIESKKPKLNLTSNSSEVGILKKELGKSRRHKPLRKLFAEIKNLVFALKPCFMMSPLSVATFIDPNVLKFDVVIFDEASQIMVEDAISSIARGKQVIIVGDSKQLPPTSFFKVNEDLDFDEDLEDAVSILDEGSTILGTHMLNWHYRSKCESLISFSNEHFYNHDLITFPAPNPNQFSIDFIYVDDGIYDRGGTRQNLMEAKRVVELIKEHYDKTPNLSLGVLAFSIAQQQAILDVLDEFLRENPDYSKYINADLGVKSFFVKNLETVQGDERDVIILSLGYGRDNEGNLSLNFGPLNREGGVKRLNVAITRAIHNIKIVSSILPNDINEDRTKSEGLKMLKKYLEYARSGSFNTLVKSNVRKVSDLQHSIKSKLDERGYNCDLNVGTSKFKIDIAIKDPNERDKYLLAIDLDYNAYKNANTVRDRERIRHEVLESLGWKVYRIWSYDWMVNSDLEIERIKGIIENTHVQSSNTSEDNRQRRRVDFFDEDLLKVIKDYKYYIPENIEGGERAYLSFDFFPLIKEIVEVEQPIEPDLVYGRILDVFKVKDSKKLKTRFDNILSKHIFEKDLIMKDGSLWVEDPSYAVNIRLASVDLRPLSLIPIPELRLAVLLVVDNSFSIFKDDISREVMKFYGAKRSSHKFKEKVLNVVDELFEKGFLALNSDGKVVLKND